MVTTKKINDLGKDNWKEYADAGSSLWHFARDEDTEKKKFYGGFVYQVAENLIIRYTQKGDWVLDPFGGSGTTERASVALGRNSVLSDYNFESQVLATDFRGENGTKHHKYQANAAHSSYSFDYLRKYSQPALTILHPPYFDVIKFAHAGRVADLSNMPVKKFCGAMKVVFENAFRCTAPHGFVALVFGDTYKEGVLTPAYRIARIGDRLPGLSLKAIFVKNITGNEMHLGKDANLWKYRALTNGFAVFQHEYIFVWRKVSE